MSINNLQVILNNTMKKYKLKNIKLLEKNMALFLWDL